MNKWFIKLPFWRKKQVCLQAIAGMYYDFYSEDELMQMFKLDDIDIETFDYDEYFKHIYEYEEYCNGWGYENEEKGDL